MSQIAASADETICCSVKALGRDMEASLALNRALIQTIASLSPTLNVAAERALDEEIAQARRLPESQRTIAIIESVRTGVADSPREIELMGRLERALIAAADALPDIHDIDAAEAASLARG